MEPSFYPKPNQIEENSFTNERAGEEDFIIPFIKPFK